MRHLPRFLSLLCLLALLPCGAALAQFTVYSSGPVAVGTTRQLTAYVPLPNPAVSWSVNGVTGGAVATGTVSSTGLYSAPMTVPVPNAVTVTATNIADPTRSASVTLTITQVQPRLWSTAPRSVPVGAFTLTLNGAAFTANAVVSFGGVALPTTLVSPTSLTASGIATAAQLNTDVPVVVGQTGPGGVQSDVVTVRVTADAVTPPSRNPGPTPNPTPNPTPSPGSGLGTANVPAARLLEQAAFGPTPAAIARVQALGAAGWIAEQLAMPETAVADPGGTSVAPVQAQYLARLANAPDQLRQRVAYELAQILVISLNKNIYLNEVLPYLQILSRNAFGNYRTLLGEIAVSSQMGKYLDLANSNKPQAGSGANENFARELLQLFTIGLNRLNPDATPQTDGAGRPLPAYTQADVQQLALAFTGWTYAGSGNNNWENFSGPLVPRDVNHDQTAKQFLGCSGAAGRTAQQDMDAALDCVFAHPNVGPFVALRLIRGLVTSNPTPAYVARIAAVFNNNGSGVRGDLRAVVRAILLDSEARQDAAPPGSGRLKDPVQQVTGLVRALGGSIAPTNQLAWNFSLMAETLLTPPSVFGFYSPLYRIPRSTMAGPEFQIYSPTEAVQRGNFIYGLLSNPGADVALDIGPFVAVAGNTATLIDKVDQALLYGRMPAAMRQSLAYAAAAQGDNRSRALTVLYLTALSGLQLVQY